MKQKEVARWLKVIVVVTCLIGMAACCWVAPMLGLNFALVNPDLKWLFWPCLIFIWISAIPFYWILVIGWRLCSAIERDDFFSDYSARCFKHISLLALIECPLYLAGMIALFAIQLLHPSIFMGMGLVVFIGLAIALIAAALSHLIQKAADMKKENDLTV